MLSDLDRADTPTPVSSANRFLPQTETVSAVYDGSPLAYFIANQGGDPVNVREFLRLNRIGNTFEELYEGKPVEVHL